jgi:nucleotide-binding universal stress UspA family protein
MTGQNARAFDATSITDARRVFMPTMAKPRILCATDLSQDSPRVVSRAAVMANQLDATLILLHVIAPDQGSAAFASASEHVEVQLRSIQPPACYEVAVRVEAGEYVPTIAAVADETAAGLILVGSPRWKPLAPLIPTIAGQLAALVQRPVLIVKRDSHVPYSAVLIAAEESAGFGQVLRTTSALRLLESESVAIIHGFESPHSGPLYASGFDLHASKRNTEEWELAARRRLLQNLEAAGVASDRLRLVFVQSRPVRPMRKEVLRVGPELLVLATQQHSTLDRVMRDSVGNDIPRHNECDILIAPMS